METELTVLMEISDPTTVTETVAACFSIEEGDGLEEGLEKFLRNCEATYRRAYEKWSNL